MLPSRCRALRRLATRLHWNFSRHHQPAPIFRIAHVSRRNFSAQGADREPSSLLGKQQKNNKSLLYYMIAFVAAMVALSYASVPLYRLFCQVTGLGGTTQRVDPKKRKKIDMSRELTVHFKGQTQGSLPWSFEPLQSTVEVHPGESVLAFYRATNHSDEPIIGIATYMVTPSAMGKYFTKIECFCFDEQRLGPHESLNMPVLFSIDTDVSQNALLKETRNVTLSYTFFRSSDQTFDLGNGLEALNHSSQSIPETHGEEEEGKGITLLPPLRPQSSSSVRTEV